MVRFTSTALRPALNMTRNCHTPLILEKGHGIYIRVPDNDNSGQWLRAFAEGCNPFLDKDWSRCADMLIPETEYTFTSFICQNTWDDVVHKHYDLLVSPTGTTAHFRAQPPEKQWVLVGDYRNGIDRLSDQTYRHFSSCVGKREISAWRANALFILDQVIRLDCKRAKPEDRDNFERAIRRIKGRISSVTPDGDVLAY